MNRKIVVSIAVIVIGGTGLAFWKQNQMRTADLRTPMVSTAMHGADAAAPARPADQIKVPKLSASARMGEVAFNENCAACHGENAAGTDKGPPLIHKIYEPSHHADYAFQMAAQRGVTAHHWRFGNMPPVPGVTPKQVDWIIAYVREVQRANGIN